MPARKLVFIMVDTQRWDMLGCYGNPDMKTPHLDKLASQGVRFERAFCAQPVCGPARSTIFTGLYPHTTGVWANCMAPQANVKTLGQRLSDNGFHTAYIGKWHLDGGDYFGLGRCPDGWDEDYWYDMRCYLEELTPEERLRSRDYRTSDDPELKEDFLFAHRCSNRAIDFLAKYHEEDFCLVVSYDEPHGPSLAPRSYSQLYKDYEWPKKPRHFDTLENKPAHQRAWAGERLQVDKSQLKIQAPYLLGCNSYVDYEIGRVLEAVDEYAPDALVVYTADHGDMLWAHSLYGKGPAMYEDITRVPLLVRWPGEVPAGTVCEHPVSHVDLVPTLMEAAGLPLPQWREGDSMLATWREPSLKPREAVFIEFGRYETDHDGFGGFQPVRCVFDGRYKLVVNLLTSDELYDLQADPEELENLIDSEAHAEIRNELHDRLLEEMNRTRDPFRGYYWERRPWRKDARAATWSYTGMTRQREHEEYEPRQLDYDTGLPMKEATRPK